MLPVGKSFKLNCLREEISLIVNAFRVTKGMATTSKLIISIGMAINPIKFMY